jgi:hypothetical protein
VPAHLAYILLELRQIRIHYQGLLLFPV